MALKNKTRLAPSPTGALHLGNVRTFLINWALAKQHNWEILLRIEDLDGPRVKKNADQDAIDILEWLGMDWDEGPIYQRHDLSAYQAALNTLGRKGAIYPCSLSRKDIEALSAPQEGNEMRCEGHSRPNEKTPVSDVDLSDPKIAWRLWVEPGVTQVNDQFIGLCEEEVSQAVGDFVLATKEGLPSYQLAVVVDDARQGVTHVVRGDDLLNSAARQMLIYEHLGLSPIPVYYHLPLIIGEDGRRLAKRHGDTRLTHYREQGVSAERILGLMAHWCGLGEKRPMTIKEFLNAFDLNRVPKQAITYTKADEAWLMESA